MEKHMETNIMGHIGAAIRIHAFIPSQRKASYACMYI